MLSAQECVRSTGGGESVLVEPLLDFLMDTVA